MEQQYYEIQSNFSPVYKTANILIKERGYDEICYMLTDAEISVVYTRYDNINGGTDIYAVYIDLPVTKYSEISSQKIMEIEKVISDSLNEVNKKDDSWFYVKIKVALTNLDELPQEIDTFVELNDWERIKRTVTKIKRDSGMAQNEEEFQAIGLLCRDVIISLAQTVYNPSIHGVTDDKGTVIGSSDAVRMLKNYIYVSLKGKHNDEARAFAKAANDLANHLTHKRDATKKDMLLTISSTIALINFIGIIEDKY